MGRRWVAKSNLQQCRFSNKYLTKSHRHASWRGRSTGCRDRVAKVMHYMDIKIFRPVNRSQIWDKQGKKIERVQVFRATEGEDLQRGREMHGGA